MASVRGGKIQTRRITIRRWGNYSPPAGGVDITPPSVARPTRLQSTPDMSVCVPALRGYRETRRGAKTAVIVACHGRWG